ncbi:hypothetical protein TKK_0010211 [Trichogramma kaykai]
MLSKTFEPITKPLHKLVDQTTDEDDGSINKKSVKNILQNVKKEEKEEIPQNVENHVDEENNITDKSEDITFPLNDGGRSEKKLKSLPNSGYLKFYLAYVTADSDPHQILDQNGVRKGDGNNSYQLKFGRADISFKDEVLVLNDVHAFKMTPGLIELIFKKIPLDSIITEADKEAYREILEISSAHRLNNDPRQMVRQWKHVKYTKYIHPMFPSSKSGKGMSSRLMKDYKIAYLKLEKFCRYWDDSNELCERLKLLIAEKKAGNGAHHNEIHSIMEELREGGYIS